MLGTKGTGRRQTTKIKKANKKHTTQETKDISNIGPTKKEGVNPYACEG